MLLHPKKIRDAIYDMRPFEGVSGTIDFVDSGDPDKAAVVLRFEKGKVLFHRLVRP